MFEELNSQLVRVKGDIRKKEKFKKQLADYKQDLLEINDIIVSLEKNFAAEQADVQKLISASVTNLLVTILGSKEDRLTKEKQELVAVQLKLEEATKSKIEIENAIKELQERLLKLGDIKNDYQTILSTKERIIKESNSSYAIQLSELSELEGDKIAYISELDEAIIAGNAVIRILKDATQSLEGAQGWGTLDMFGGGMISGAVKHNHIDHATEYIHQAQSSMRRFQKELLDINEESDMQVDISGLLKFADFFFDGLIADWMVQGKIDQSLEQTRSQQNKINSIVSKLKVQMEQKEGELTSIKRERENLLESL